MAKKNVSPAVVATAIFVIATLKTRCRAGFVFNNETQTRIELEKLTPEQVSAIEADPYLKITWEGEEDPEAVTAEARILELETLLTAKEAEVEALKKELALADKLKLTCEEQIAEYKAALEAKEAEIAELKAATKAKK